MTRDLKELIREASELPENDRATLARAMIESLDPKPTPEIKAAWSREIERRVREMENGTVELIEWERSAASCSRMTASHIKQPSDIAAGLNWGTQAERQPKRSHKQKLWRQPYRHELLPLSRGSKVALNDGANRISCDL